MKKILQKIVIAILILGALALLRFYFKNSYLSIVMLLALGLLAGTISRFFVGYIVPSQILFRYRFIIYGIGFGLMIGVTMSLVKSAEEQILFSQELIKWIIIGAPVGILCQSSAIYSRFRKLKKRTISRINNQIIISDFASVTDSEYHTARGLLVLSDNKLLFYDNYKYECLLEMSLFEINPETTKSKFLGIPNGFNLKDESYTIKVAFPLYWKKLIEIEKKKQIASTI